MLLRPSNSDNLRPIDVHTDLPAIADLIDLSFSQTMDEDGREYLAQVRDAARRKRYIPYYPGPNGNMISSPMFGFVWTVDKKIVGNINMAPYRVKKGWIYLLVNIAVHPDFRRQGIARHLIYKAIEKASEHGIQTLWLQVREENKNAIRLYESLNFIEKFRRTTWRFDPFQNHKQRLTNTKYHIQDRQTEDWEKQLYWLHSNYPDQIAWGFHIDWNEFSPSLWRSVVRFFTETRLEHWTIRDGRNLAGVCTWLPDTTSCHTLWLAAEQNWDEAVISSLVPHVIGAIQSDKPVIINYPAGRALPFFETAGFRNHVTLCWMELKIKSTPVVQNTVFDISA